MSVLCFTSVASVCSLLSVGYLLPVCASCACDEDVSFCSSSRLMPSQLTSLSLVQSEGLVKLFLETIFPELIRQLSRSRLLLQDDSYHWGSWSPAVHDSGLGQSATYEEANDKKHNNFPSSRSFRSLICILCSGRCRSRWVLSLVVLE